MAIHSRNNEKVGTKEENSMIASEVRGKRMITFHEAHPASQDVAVVEQESFEEHDAKMRVFRRNHPNILELAAVNTGGVKKSLKLAVWTTLIPLESSRWLGFSPN